MYKIMQNVIRIASWRVDNGQMQNPSRNQPVSEHTIASVKKMNFGNGVRMRNVNIVEDKEHYLLRSTQIKTLPAFDDFGKLHTRDFVINRNLQYNWEIYERLTGEVKNKDIRKFPYDLGDCKLHWDGHLSFVVPTEGTKTLKLGYSNENPTLILNENAIPPPKKDPSDVNRPETSCLGLFWEDGSFYEFVSTRYVNNTGDVQKPPSTGSVAIDHEWKMYPNKICNNKETIVYNLHGRKFPYQSNNVYLFSNGWTFSRKIESFSGKEKFSLINANKEEASKKTRDFDGCKVGINYKGEWIIQRPSGDVMYPNNATVDSSDPELSQYLISIGTSVFSTCPLPCLLTPSKLGKKAFIFEDGSRIVPRDHAPPNANLYQYENPDSKVINMFGMSITVGAVKITPLTSEKPESFVIETLEESNKEYATADGSKITEAKANELKSDSTAAPTPPAPAPAPPAPAPTPPALAPDVVDFSQDLTDEFKNLKANDPWFTNLPSFESWKYYRETDSEDAYVRRVQNYKDESGSEIKLGVKINYYDTTQESDDSQNVQIFSVDVHGNFEAQNTDYFFDSTQTNEDGFQGEIFKKKDFWIPFIKSLEQNLNLPEAKRAKPEDIFDRTESKKHLHLSIPACALYFRIGNTQKAQRGNYILIIKKNPQYSIQNQNSVEAILLKKSGFENGTNMNEFVILDGGVYKNFNTQYVLECDARAKSIEVREGKTEIWKSNFQGYMSEKVFYENLNNRDNFAIIPKERARPLQAAFDPEFDMEVDVNSTPEPPANLLDKARSIFGNKQDPKAAAKRAAAEELTTKKAPGKRKISAVRED